MRIIAGTHRHRIIQAPRDSEVTRPMPDRVKQSLFDRLWSMGLLGDSPAEFGPPEMVGGGCVLDLFAGTGSLGLEALSRGAEHCTFIEHSRGTRQVLEQNIDDLGLREQANVLGVDALSTGWVAVLTHKPVRIVFVDPPYRLTEDADSMPRVAGVMTALAGAQAMEPGGVLILRTESHAQAPAPGLGWGMPQTTVYGSMSVHFYVASAATSATPSHGH